MVQHAPNIEWHFRAVERIERLLKTVTSALDAAGIEYAVIGGNAVATWVASRDEGAVRATKDVDILLRKSDIQRVADTLAPLGFISADVMGIPVFMEASHPLPSQGVHVIVAGEKVRQTSCHVAPDVRSVTRSASGHLVLDLLPLVMMKLDAFRLRDQTHLVDMLSVGLLDASWKDKLPEDLRPRFEQVLEAYEREERRG
ncbi:MAG: hypothetical protein FLDDKLPJ_01602 [Phycisphaerae bacterium]|nr:hypothetical protein [Phycisphaerae bacterium]